MLILPLPLVRVIVPTAVRDLAPERGESGKGLTEIALTVERFMV
jgi:hypothetical protein